MEALISLLLGFFSGLLYNEHIYRQAIRFPRKSPLLSFWVRLSLLGAITLAVALHFSPTALILFLTANLLARLVHTLLRGFVIVRY